MHILIVDLLADAKPLDVKGFEKFSPILNLQMYHFGHLMFLNVWIMNLEQLLNTP